MRELTLQSDETELGTTLTGLTRRLDQLREEGLAGVIHQKKRPEHEFDYGDDDSILLHLKLKDVDCFGPDGRFGMFVGKTEKDEYAVIRFVPPVGHVVEAVELFETEVEMKNRWRLD